MTPPRHSPAEVINVQQIALTVTDIRQFDYCPRVVYFTYVQPLERPVTYKMQHGMAEGDRVAALEKRRSLHRYGLDAGERTFDCWLESAQLALTGKADLLILTEQAVWPVEFKFTTAEPGHNHRLQLTAYAMMAAERFDRPADSGFICRLTDGHLWRLPTDGFWRHQVHELLDEMRRMISAEAFPPPPGQPGKCTDCEFRRFCADV